MNNYILHFWFKGSSIAHVHNVYDTQESAIKTANRWLGINSIRAVVLYDESMNVVYRRGDV